MLNKAAHIVLTMLLLIATIGLTVEKHYCGTRLVSVSLFGDPDPCCDTDAGCCHNDSDTFVLKADYTTPQSLAAFESFIPDAVAHPAVVHSLAVSERTDGPEHAGLSPPISVRPKLSSLQTYRF